jgi:molybdopterin molybdotransferase
MLTPAEAEILIARHLQPFHREHCPLAAAHGRVLLEPIRADRDLPPFDRVTMDGYALRSAAWTSGIRSFRVERIQAAGMRAFALDEAPEACIEVMTGAVLPEGADSVVPYEETERDGSRMTVREGAAGIAPGFSVHRRGSDHRAGEEIVAAGTRLGGREIAVAAACGRSSLSVSQIPRIAVVATGDELVEVESPVAAHQIRRSNDHAIRAALALAGYPNAERFHLRDLPQEVEHRLWHILAEYEVVILTGGVSKGRFDLLPAELERQGVRKILQGVAQRPGKPLWVGVSDRGVLVFALPGNPVSAYTCLHRYVIPALELSSGIKPVEPRLVPLASAYVFRPKLACLLPVKLANGPDGMTRAVPMSGNTSGDLAGLVGTDGFVELPADAGEFPAGTLTPFRAW